MYRHNVIIQVKYGPTGCRPERSYPGDAGDDLYVSENVVVPPLSSFDVPTDISVKLPDGFFGRIIGRSSTMRRHGLVVLEGVIDNGFTGSLFVCVFNPKSEPVVITAGQRLAQFILHPIVETRYQEVQELPKTERGDSGFGSSGT